MEDTIKKFKQGTQYLNVLRPLTKEDLYNSPINTYEPGNLHFTKFVPASGAATRMFKDFYQYLNDGIETDTIHFFFDHLEEFPFYEDLYNEVSRRGDSMDSKRDVVEVLINEFASQPKILLDIHYDEADDTLFNIFDEHIIEGQEYLKDQNYAYHFTISKEHIKKFKRLNKKTIGEDISYSTQLPETDTLAVDMDNNPFKLENGKDLYRPGGHGALIHNLNELNTDVILIKTMDNVCHHNLLPITVEHKQKLINIGLTVKEQLDTYTTNLLEDTYDLKTIEKFITDVFKISTKEKLTKDIALNILNRPLRIVGLVKNQGEPGGGPFLVQDGEMSSPQILETKELAPESSSELLAASQYFSPTDLVCFVKDHHGNKYNLLDYVNKDRYFVTEKTYKGRQLKAIEHPGLWNGAMHNWNTVFVEVPLETFNPLKNVKDYLRKGHTGE